MCQEHVSTDFGDRFYFDWSGFAGSEASVIGYAVYSRIIDPDAFPVKGGSEFMSGTLHTARL